MREVPPTRQTEVLEHEAAMAELDRLAAECSVEPEPPDYASLDVTEVADRLFEMAMLYHYHAGCNQHFERCERDQCILNREALRITGGIHGYKRWDRRETRERTVDCAT